VVSKDFAFGFNTLIKSSEMKTFNVVDDFVLIPQEIQ
jgi:hypothetical protein